MNEREQKTSQMKNNHDIKFRLEPGFRSKLSKQGALNKGLAYIFKVASFDLIYLNTIWHVDIEFLIHLHNNNNTT